MHVGRSLAKSSSSYDAFGHAGKSDPLWDARTLHRQVVGLVRLLEYQRQQIETLNERLYADLPGDIAARRLLALKHAQMSDARVA